MFEHRIIECAVKDSSDYDWLYDNAIQTTLESYFKWADENGGTIHFEKSWADVSYGLTLRVDAKIDNAETFALFKLTYGNKPFNRLDTNTMEFIHG